MSAVGTSNWARPVEPTMRVRTPRWASRPRGVDPPWRTTLRVTARGLSGAGVKVTSKRAASPSITASLSAATSANGTNGTSSPSLPWFTCLTYSRISSGVRGLNSSGDIRRCLRASSTSVSAMSMSKPSQK